LLIVLNDAHPNGAARPPEVARGNGAALQAVEPQAPVTPAPAAPAD
jgi:hypothetical protein